MSTTSTSTLVETVSINYEDFSENFLTCGTCLCVYDAQEHTPKLLSCSHTVCRSCLERIVLGVGIRDAGSFRCPICRETIPLPRAGVAALPPSFLVNQLLDLMAQQRREVIPKCSVHLNQELLFCETCDRVFCQSCEGGSSHSQDSDHTVIPFSVAIKRMSEILLYKAHLCLERLSQAAENVQQEMSALEQSAEKIENLVEQLFQDILEAVQRRKKTILDQAKSLCNEKRQVLQEQLDLIMGEREGVEEQCHRLEYQVDVRNLSRQIEDLNKKMDSVGVLLDPRENSYLKFHAGENDTPQHIERELAQVGRLQTSRTLPSLCLAEVLPAPCHLETRVLVRTVDYQGSWQTDGGDPLLVEVFQENGQQVLPLTMKDMEDGSYEVRFRPIHPGLHRVEVSIFQRPIRGSPLLVDVSEHINPVSQFGGNQILSQPVGLAANKKGEIFVLDTGNSRISVLTPDLQLVHYLEGCAGMEDRAGTGITATLCDSLLVINWRRKEAVRLDQDGGLLGRFTCEDLHEPTSIVVDNRGLIWIGDNSAKALFVFDSQGTLLKRVPQTGYISGLASGPEDQILVAGAGLAVLSPVGELIRELCPDRGKGKGSFGGVCCDGEGLVLATHSDKGGSCVRVYDFLSGLLLFVIDSWEAKLKRPSGVLTLPGYKALVVDLGNDCLKMFRYR